MIKKWLGPVGTIDAEFQLARKLFLIELKERFNMTGNSKNFGLTPEERLAKEDKFLKDEKQEDDPDTIYLETKPKKKLTEAEEKEIFLKD